MTIGLGFTCADGLVVAADTEEFYGEYTEFKANVQKLYQPYWSARGSALS